MTMVVTLPETNKSKLKIDGVSFLDGLFSGTVLVSGRVSLGSCQNTGSQWSQVRVIGFPS